MSHSEHNVTDQKEVTKMSFLSEIAVINNSAKSGIPSHTGKLVVIVENIGKNSNFDYWVITLGDNVRLKVKESELERLTFEEAEFFVTVKKDDKVIFQPTGEIATVTQFDYLHKQVSIQFESDNGSRVVGIKQVRKLDEESDSVEEEYQDDSILLLNTFLSQYKNNDDTYTVPKQVLVNLIKQAFGVVESC